MMLVQYTLENNKANFLGSNQVLDFVLNLLPLPFFGVHLGYLLGAIRPIFQLVKKLDKGKTVHVFGHSLGGGVGQIVAVILLLLKYKVVVETVGAVSSVSFIWRIIFKKLGGVSKIRIYGNDPVPRLWPWFFNLSKAILEGPERKWWKANFKDHVRY